MSIAGACKVVPSREVSWQLGAAANEVSVGVRDYAEFNEDNDPYGEHDFGSLKVARQRVFWKIDYYDEKDDDEKRQILIELFENIMFENDAVSVSLKDRAELIAKYSSKTRELLGTRKSNDRTFTNSKNNRGQNNEKSAENALYPLWQGYMDEDRTFYSVSENAILGGGDV